MKSNTNNKSKSANQFLLMLCSSFILLAGCEKAEMQQLSSEAESKSDLKTVLPPPPAYTMLIIEHNALTSSFPDYDVYLLSDGSVIYRGWSNVAVKGRRDFNVDAATVSYIKSLFESANFFSISPIPHQDGDPVIYTTFSNRIQTKQLFDYDMGMPQLLIQIRKRAEEKLNISQYVQGEKLNLISSTL
ncbi:MAG: DUF6438 domain-containing protein [Bacteroidia bacterium]